MNMRTASRFSDTAPRNSATSASVSFSVARASRSAPSASAPVRRSRLSIVRPSLADVSARSCETFAALEKVTPILSFCAASVVVSESTLARMRPNALVFSSLSRRFAASMMSLEPEMSMAMPDASASIVGTPRVTDFNRGFSAVPPTS